MTNRATATRILFFLAAATVAVLRPPAAVADERPNFIVIYTDDQGYNDLACFGSSMIKTPHLDRMAADGLRLTSFYAQPVCGVSRAALMTGSYPIRIAEPGNLKRLHTVPHPNEWTMAEMLKDAGYATALIGKWHLCRRDAKHPTGFDAATMPNAQGFDYFYGTPVFNGFTTFVKGASFRSAILRNDQIVKRAVQSWDSITADYTSEALQWIEKSRDRRFFLHLAHNMPHIPLGASEGFKGRSAYGPYGDAIEEIDWSCGKIFAKLKSLGLDESTFVIFTSDNGPWIETTRAMKPGAAKFIPRNHSGTADPLRGWKMSAWDGGSRVPCIVRWPGRIRAGRVSDEILTTMDLLPTFASLAGVKILTSLELDGGDASDFLLGKTDQSPRDEFLYYAGCLLTGVRAGKWKLVLPRTAHPAGTGWWGRMIDAVPQTQLFNLDDDPGEANDLAAEHPQIVAALMKRIERARAELGDIDRNGSGARFFDDGPRRLEAGQSKRSGKPQGKTSESQTSRSTEYWPNAGACGDKSVIDRVARNGVLFTQDARATAASDALDELAVVRARYRQWLLDDDPTSYSRDFVARQYRAALHRARRAVRGTEAIDFDRGAGLYDTRKSGPDRQEMDWLVTEVLPNLSVAYQLRGPRPGDNPFYHDEQTLSLLMRAFDRLHERGFRPGMQMPWKSKDSEETEPPTAIVVDFHLRTAGYALATLLMRDELLAAGKLDRTLQTCEAIAGHGEKTGDLGKLKLNADGVRIAVNFVLPYALAADDTKRLMHFKRQLERSMAIESDASDTIKPDGLGFHHLGVYLAGYAPYAVAQAAQAAWLLRDTEYELTPETIVNLRKSMLTLRVVSQKYDMHKALAGRLRGTAVIPDVMLGYAYLAAMEEDDDELNRALARLCDAAFLKSDLRARPFSSSRNEARPGPGAVQFFFETLAAADRVGAEAEPVGHWALNYGPLSVHRRDNWMVSVKGFSEYLWAFERSLSDALGEDRLQNVLGFHDSSCTIRIHSRGEPVSAAGSGYTTDGWDWCHRPGATVRLIPAAEMLTRSARLGREQSNRPFGSSTIAGGVSLSGKHGLFAMQYAEASCDGRQPRLEANKSVFFFDNQIVVLTSDIRNGDGEFPVVTTLYQCGLTNPRTPTWTRGRRTTGLDQQERLDDARPLTLIDPVGNGYYIPRAENVVVTRRRQESLDYTATMKTTGDFATAWFDHGTNPDKVGCEYVILVNSSPDQLERFAGQADQHYSVLRRDSVAHIVTHRKMNLTGYALFQSDTKLPDGLVERVDTPCMLMTHGESDSVMRVSVCNPDFGWKAGRQYNFRPKNRDDGPPMVAPATPVKITLRGVWQLRKPSAEVNVRTRNRSTIVHVNGSDARSVDFDLLRSDNAGAR